MDDAELHDAPPESVSELFDRLDRLADRLPKRLRQCADFLRAHADLVAVSTVAEMAEAAEVAPSAFMRFCQALGFSGYSQMQALFRAEYAQSRPDYAERLQELRAQGAPDAPRMLVDLAEAGHKSLTGMVNHLDHEVLERVVEEMLSADLIHVVGMRRAFSVASYLAYLLDRMEQPSLLHAAPAGLGSPHAFAPGQLVFAITYQPFSPETVELAERADAAGVRVVLLTDSADCAIAAFAGEVLIAREVDVGGFRVPTASLTLVTALAVALGERVGPR